MAANAAAPRSRWRWLEPIAGVAVSVTGGFLFLRYSLARFLRFWLLRQSYEQRAAIEDAGRAE